MVINAHHLTKSGHHLEAALVHVLIDPCLWFQQCRTVGGQTTHCETTTASANVIIGASPDDGGIQAAVD